MLRIIQHRKIYFILSGATAALALLSLIVWGVKPAIDFTGGSLIDLGFTGNRPQVAEVQKSLADLKLGEIRVQPVGDLGLLLRLKNINETTHQNVLEKLNVLANQQTQPVSNEESASSSASTVEKTPAIKTSTISNKVIENRFTSIGPVVGRELKSKMTLAVILASICIILYIAWAFRHVSRPIKSWKFGVCAIIALLHDLIIVTGIFSVLGHFFNIEIDVLFVSALLTILGYSVHDTIVVYDRIRENLRHYQGIDFEEVANNSVNVTIIRSLNTSIATELALVAVYLFGGDSIRNFALALIFGIFFGTYSSIFVASALLVFWNKWDIKRRRA